MSILQSQARSISNSKASIKTGNLGSIIGIDKSAINGEIEWSDADFDNSALLIKKADTVSFIEVCKHYGIEIDQYNKKVLCPFKFHNDKSASFYYYPDTNSFYCWGCKNGGGPTYFVSLLEDIGKITAAEKLLEGFESEEIDLQFLNQTSEKQEIQLEFSRGVRDFLRSNPTEMNFADKITQSFDIISQRHKIDSAGLRLSVGKLLERLKEYRCP